LLLKRLGSVFQMHISTDIKQRLSVSPIHQQHAAIFSQTFIY